MTLPSPSPPPLSPSPPPSLARRLRRGNAGLRLAVVVGATSCLAVLSGCGAGPPPAAHCTPPPGGRCAGPAPLSSALVGPLAASPDGRQVHGRFRCGGKLTGTESSQQVSITYHASAVGAGRMACAIPILTLQLGSPIGHRAIVDGVSGQALSVAPGS